MDTNKLFNAFSALRPGQDSIVDNCDIEQLREVVSNNHLAAESYIRENMEGLYNRNKYYENYYMRKSFDFDEAILDANFDELKEIIEALNLEAELL